MEQIEIKRTHFVDLDVVVLDGETVDDAANDVMDGFVVSHQVLMERGSGGGWPVVRFTGGRDELVRMLEAYVGNGDRGALKVEIS